VQLVPITQMEDRMQVQRKYSLQYKRACHARFLARKIRQKKAAGLISVDILQYLWSFEYDMSVVMVQVEVKGCRMHEERNYFDDTAGNVYCPT
jgi:hypothetical protein